jgi:hypothetical protein
MQQVLAMFYERIILAIELTPKARGAYRGMLLVCVTLVVVFALTISLVRALRRYRQTHMTSRPKPTPSGDVWKQHRLPDDWEKQIEPDQPPKDK